ncbi:hypothetical protein [Carnobacterium iners]|uniref:hypothetical protein n=1 Tax=Carnobacterium iners TaxID=1073423 RepID=UPI00115FE26B|nr:hypothetical protein [Carnobacterium iners]
MIDPIPSYSLWLGSLKAGDSILLREATVGTTTNFIYISDIIECFTKEKISLTSKVEPVNYYG